jgi:hypothetical protein
VKPGCLERICVRCEACRRKLCATPAGALLNNITKPLTGLTGGVIPPFCPILPSAADLAKPGVAGPRPRRQEGRGRSQGPADGRALPRHARLPLLPHASIGLAAALRTDPSECVRFEAALALANGCCCNRITLAALEASVSGLDLDGNPAERSVRVRCTAAIALEKCLACYVPPAPDPVEVPKTIEGKPTELPETKTTDERKMDTKATPAPTPSAVERARKTLAAFRRCMPTPCTPRRTRDWSRASSRC